MDPSTSGNEATSVDGTLAYAKGDVQGSCPLGFDAPYCRAP
jgi:hypothetical protein